MTYHKKVLLGKMAIPDTPSPASNFGSHVAASDLTYANGSTDHNGLDEGLAFPSVFRNEQEISHTALPGDGISSVINTSNTGVLPSSQEKKSDALAPRPETRRLGYFSVAALIINRMIGGSFLTIPPPWLIVPRIGTGIFSTPSSVLKGTGGSKGAALFLWVLGSIATLAGL